MNTSDSEIQQQQLLDLNIIESNVPARLDRLPFSRFHLLVMCALGASWVLDGLEVTIVSLVGTILKRKDVLNLSDSQVGLIGTVYLSGAITGSIILGRLSDKLGRKKMFMICPCFYLIGSILLATSWNFGSFICFMILIGFGIGGEYASVNSTVDELIPARLRGRVNIMVNGSYWLGGIIAASLSFIILDTKKIPAHLGWRIFFIIMGILGIIILLLRRMIPESPRWALIHGQVTKAEKIIKEIELRVYKNQEIPEPPNKFITISQSKTIGYKLIMFTMFRVYLKRSILALSLMIGQAFLYNSIFFSYAQVLNIFYNVKPDGIGIYLLFFCICNFLGPLSLGRLFDKIGRKPMISFTYFSSAILLIITSILFVNNKLTATTQTLCWSIIFFIASAGASSAYLTVSEIFPLELRSLAISLVYSIGTGLGGLMSPYIFGTLIETHKKSKVLIGYIIGSCLMIFASIMELLLGIKGEGKSLEEITPPLSSVLKLYKK